MFALCRIAQLFGIVGHKADTKSYIQYSMNTYPIVTTSTLEIGAAQLRSVTPLLRNRAEITVFMFEQKLYPVWLSCMRRSYPV